jgi:hypothetical protein
VPAAVAAARSAIEAFCRKERPTPRDRTRVWLPDVPWIELAEAYGGSHSASTSRVGRPSRTACSTRVLWIEASRRRSRRPFSPNAAQPPVSGRSQIAISVKMLAKSGANQSLCADYSDCSLISPEGNWRPMNSDSGQARIAPGRRARPPRQIGARQ